jgi:hypothetical protein
MKQKRMQFSADWNPKIALEAILGQRTIQEMETTGWAWGPATKPDGRGLWRAHWICSRLTPENALKTSRTEILGRVTREQVEGEKKHCGGWYTPG